MHIHIYIYKYMHMYIYYKIHHKYIYVHVYTYVYIRVNIYVQLLQNQTGRVTKRPPPIYLSPECPFFFLFLRAKQTRAVVMETLSPALLPRACVRARVASTVMYRRGVTRGVFFAVHFHLRAAHFQPS